MNAPAIELRSLSKSFGELRANAGVDLRVERGSIHAIIGENGAGKSTAMKMLYGLYRPDSGEILIDGIARQWSSPRDAIAAGIGMVHQHFMLAEPETALENVLLEGDCSGSGNPLRLLNRRAALAKLEKLAREYQMEVDWGCRVRDLPVGVQQRIEILKLLYNDASILILDEPTAVLTPQETEQLFSNLKKLASQGKTILIITHKLKEVMGFADRASVLRAGVVVGHREVSQTSADELATLMVGRKVNLRATAPPPCKPGRAVVELRGSPSLSVHEGEIVGIAGVEGNGQSELLQRLTHSGHFREGGVGLIPEDRLLEGLLLESDLSENFLLGLHNRAPFRSGWRISYSSARERTQAAIREYDIRPPRVDAIAGRLSGGNQQKLIIAREFEAKPRFLIAAQPTRGVDVGAIEQIHERILRARNEGMGILLVSSELDEILALSDRVLVIYRGEIVAGFSRADADEKRIGLAMGGAHV